ncbi:MAG: winged helix-turn-helix domain-containing protein [Acidobacteria bacterium]|jgi:DNA-binding winged helix-turn-helix (wHTH) protein|nr:winged helix-turn-helix domain-containing protein [Acidobacteriota bacterium]
MRVRFASFVFDSDTRELRDGDEQVHLAPKAFDLLELLLQSRPRALSKGEIRRRVWRDTHAGDRNLNVLVAELRKALGEDAREPRFVRTVFGFGYAFAGDAAADEPETGDVVGLAIRSRVLWERKVIPLAEGENILGRDDKAVVQVDVPGVSRRHARIRIERDRAILEDLGSKNGTYLKDERVLVPTPLWDGAVFRLGRNVLVYRSAPEKGSTVTEAPSPDDRPREPTG